MTDNVAPLPGSIKIAVKNSNLPAVSVSAPLSPGEWSAMKQQAEVIYRSGLAPRSIKSAEQVLVIALKGRELSLPPMQALSHIHIVEGKPTLSAELMAALVQRAGHKIRVLETTNQKCSVEGVRADDPSHPQRVVWSMDEAKQAGVAGKGAWKSYPAAMLRARAISALCRFAFADVIMGASYTPEELGAEVTEEGEVIEAEPETAVVEDADEPNAEHNAAMNEVEDLLEQFSDSDVDKEGARSYALEGVPEARRSAAKLRQMLHDRDDEQPAPDPDEVEGVERGGASETQQDKNRLPLTAKQRSYLEALVDDVVEDGRAKFEEMVGKPIGELTREEASEWIGRLSGREA